MAGNPSLIPLLPLVAKLATALGEISVLYTSLANAQSQKLVDPTNTAIGHFRRVLHTAVGWPRAYRNPPFIITRNPRRIVLYDWIACRTNAIKEGLRDAIPMR